MGTYKKWLYSAKHNCWTSSHQLTHYHLAHTLKPMVIKWTWTHFATAVANQICFITTKKNKSLSCLRAEFCTPMHVTQVILCLTPIAVCQVRRLLYCLSHDRHPRMSGQDGPERLRLVKLSVICSVRVTGTSPVDCKHHTHASTVRKHFY